VIVAAVLKKLIPSMPWSVGFILGAIVSPPDASAATAITRKLGVPRRLITILEGESLVNDATALVAYKFAIVATLTGTFSLGLAVFKFFVVAGGGVGVGLIVGWIAIWMYQRINDVNAQILLSFLTAYACYLTAESAGVSGVMATVAGGLYFGRWIPAQATAQVRIQAKAGWDLILFILNAFVFTLINFPSFCTTFPTTIDRP
jgi:monovalent cation/hydrogen antiporter